MVSVPDAAGFGLAWKVAMDTVPDKGGNAWNKPNGFGNGAQNPDESSQDGDPSEHSFQGGFFGGDKCKYPGCGQPKEAHTDE